MNKKKILKELSSITFIGGSDVDDGPPTWYANYNSYSKDTKELAQKMGYTIIDYMVGDKMGKYYDASFKDEDKYTVSNFPVGDVKRYEKDADDEYEKWKYKMRDVAIQMGWKYLITLTDKERERLITKI